MNLQRLTALAKELTVDVCVLEVRQDHARTVASIVAIDRLSARSTVASASAETEDTARSKLEEALVLAVREAQQRSMHNELVAAFARRAALLGDLR